MPSTERLIRDRISRIESIPNRFTNAVGAMQGELFAELIQTLSSLNVGNRELSAASLAQVDELVNQYYQQLKKGKYGSYVSWFVEQIDEQKGISDAILSGSFEAIVSERAVAVHAASKAQAVRQLLGDDFKTNFINVIRDTMTQQISGGANFEGLVDGLRGLYFPDQREGQILNWSKQVASDRFAVADRAYNEVRADDLGLDFFVYDGTVIDGTRPFCEQKAGKFFHKAEALEWVNEQWAGRFRNTTAENILEWLGGYNCNHTPVYVSIFRVPKTVIERAISKGLFTPNEFERAELGL